MYIGPMNFMSNPLNHFMQFFDFPLPIFSTLGSPVLIFEVHDILYPTVDLPKLLQFFSTQALKEFLLDGEFMDPGLMGILKLRFGTPAESCGVHSSSH